MAGWGWCGGGVGAVRWRCGNGAVTGARLIAIPPGVTQVADLRLSPVSIAVSLRLAQLAVQLGDLYLVLR
jgi:hypothetical protein